MKKSKATKKKSAKASTAIGKKEETALATAPHTAWGSEDIDNADILIPKILLMQGMSKAVMDGGAVMGDFVESVGGTKVGGKDSPVEFIPFSTFKTWIVFEEEKGKLEYKQTVAMTPENVNWEQEETCDGVRIQRDRSINVYCLLQGQEHQGGAAFPYVISFRRTSYRAGRKIVTAAAKLRSFNKPLASRIFQLTSERVQNDKGTYSVMDVKDIRNSEQDELATAYKWFQALKSAKVKVDETSTIDDTVPF